MSDSPGTFCRVCRSYAPASLAVSLGACTLLDDPFEPVLTRSDAGFVDGRVLGSGAVPDASRSPGLRGCAREAGIDVENACLPALPLLDPAPESGPAQDAATPAALVGSTCAEGFGEFGAPERVSTGLGVSAGLFGAALAADGRSLYFSVLLPQSEQIYVATREAIGTTVFSNGSELPVVNSAARDGSPFLSADELRIFFFSDRSGGVGGRDIWVAERADRAAAFSAPTLLPGVNTSSFELLPWLAPDELTLLFLSNRPAGGDVDIWRATRARVDAAFGAAVNVSDLNSPANEGRTVLSSDGLSAIFSSDRAGGLGDADLWLASRPDPSGVFSAPINLAQLNSDADDLDVALSSDQRELFFSSSRTGVSTLWRSVRDCR